MDLILEYLSMQNFAHIEKSKKETIKEHNELCIKYFNKFKNELNINVFNIFGKYLNLLIDMIQYHDIGKINPRFQTEKMNNKKDKSKLCGDSSHSLYSAYFYTLIKLNEILEKEEDDTLEQAFWIINFSYLISRHHTYLKNKDIDYIYQLLQVEKESWVEEIVEKINPKYYLKDIIGLTDIKKYFFTDTVIDIMEIKEDKQAIEIYLKNKIAYSFLITCDFAATYEFFSKKEYNIYSSLNTTPYFEGELYKNITQIPLEVYDDNDINKLRTQIALEVKSNIEKSDIKNNLYQLEIPCAAGKTNCSLMSSLLLMDKDKTKKGIVYTSPFNAITDQNFNIFNNYFGNVKNITSTAALEFDTKEDEDIQTMILNYQTNNYSFICTSHVHLFDTIFGVSRNNALNLLFLSSRIIIMDEIQGYKPELWNLMLKMISQFCDFMNTTIIMMSATMPDFNQLVKGIKIKDLLPNKITYYNHKLFKNRLRFEYIGEINNLSELIETSNFYKNKKVLYEFITKKNAQMFYELLKETFPDKKIEKLSGDSNIFERLRIINEVKNSKEIIVVSTQVIEAGVDLDFDFGYKQISIADSEIQFGGRVNRNGKDIDSKEINAKFFKYGDPLIYKNDPRSITSIVNIRIQDAIRNLDNKLLYEETIQYLKTLPEKSNNEYSYNKIISYCLNSDFQEINKVMTLILDTGATLFIAFDLHINIVDLDEKNKNILIKYSKEDEFKNVIKISDKEIIISGENLWELIEEVNNNKMEFNKKFVILKKLNILKNYFSFSITKKDTTNSSIIPVINMKDLYFTNDDRFILNNSINRKELKERRCFL